jgi:Ca2+-transporting ATPase
VRPPVNRRAAFEGLGVLAIVLIEFAVVYVTGHSEFEARALSFTTLVIADLGLIFSNRVWTRSFFRRSRRRNPALWWVSGGTVLFLVSALAVPFLRDLFRFAPLNPVDLALGFGAGFASFIVSDLLKAKSPTNPARVCTPMNHLQNLAVTMGAHG